jgi:uncharacterized membrane protein
MNRRPFNVTFISWLLIAVGVLTLVYQIKILASQQGFHSEDLWISLIRILAIVCGVFMLRGHNWARWLALAWIAFHVAIGFFTSLQKAVPHTVLLLVIAYFLLRPEATAYFQHRGEAG